MESKNQFYRKHLCTNCGKPGHEFKSCREPITSYGIINIRILDNTNENIILQDKFSTRKNTCYKIISNKYPNIICYLSDGVKYANDYHTYVLDNDMIMYDEEEHIQKFWYYKNKIQFMMVSRKFSLGFVEFIRGKYDVYDPKSIINLFQQMYDSEIKFIQKNRYDDSKYQYDNILFHFLNRNDEPKTAVLNRIYEGKYGDEYCKAKIKYNMLIGYTDGVDDDIPWDLDFYIRYIKPKWKEPEWGFPKGRRERRSEQNLSCACREFEEETGYKKNEYNVLNKIEPVEERMIGTNGICYKHIYYIALNNADIDTLSDNYDKYEIGEIKWFNYDEAMSHIRPYHVEKKKILTKVYLFVLNYLIHNNNNIYVTD